MKWTCGEFTLDDETDVVTGPKRYMDERFEEFMATFDADPAYLSVAIASAYNGDKKPGGQLLAESLQLDYAGWHGLTLLCDQLGIDDDRPRCENCGRPIERLGDEEYTDYCWPCYWQLYRKSLLKTDEYRDEDPPPPDEQARMF